ncbi:MAG: hypothetical protein N2489_07025 [Clostridia bacterium]|nr:hypothetical protein [Clostridia bacterium]
MYMRNRRPYIPGPEPEKAPIADSVPSASAEDALRATLVDSLKLLSKTLEELKQSIKLMEQKIEYMDTRQRKLENDMDRLASSSRTAEMDLLNMKNDMDLLRRENARSSCAAHEHPDRPVMQGTGFASVTPSYLRSLQRR